MILNKSFTLIEATVAIFLLTVGIVGAFSLIQRTTAFSSISSSQLVATYLAQEGIEVIRNIRDTNYLQGNNWYDGIGFFSSYKLDYQSSFFPDTTCGGDYLKYDGNFYVCSPDDDAKFQREITITNPEPDKMVVSVTVSFYERGREHQVTAQTEFYHWR